MVTGVLISLLTTIYLFIAFVLDCRLLLHRHSRKCVQLPSASVLKEEAIGCHFLNLTLWTIVDLICSLDKSTVGF